MSHSVTPSPSPISRYHNFSSHPISQDSATSSSKSLLTTPQRKFNTAISSSFSERNSYTPNSRPVWKGAISKTSLSGNSSAQMESRTKFNYDGQISHGLTRSKGSYTGIQPKTDAESVTLCANGQFKEFASPSTSNHNNSTGHCLRTSTQLSESGHTQGGEEHDFDGPLSPLQITLSQMCVMENSQIIVEQDDEDQATIVDGHQEATIELTCEATTTKGVVEDSGYVSREVSTFQSPSPLSKGKVDPPPGVHEQVKSEKKSQKATERVNVGTNEDVLFAEVAMEGLNDSLEDVDDIDDDDELMNTHSQKYSQHKSKLDNQPSVQNRKSNSSSTTDHSDTTRTIHPSGVVKPLIGTLFLARLNNTRVRLEHAVKHEPPGRFTLAQLCSLGVSGDTVLARISNAADFSFLGEQYFSSAVLSGSSVCVGDGAMLKLSSNGRAGVAEFWEAFRSLSCVDEKLISYEWFVNHYKQLVWKLASLEVCYPHMLGGRCLTPDWLMLQLKYRYDREIDRAERSALHKICENDDVPSKRMVLCVSDIYKERVTSTSSDTGGKNMVQHKRIDMESGNETVMQSESSKDSESNSTNINPPCVEVTDGWYSLPCVLDNPLKQMVKSGLITVGTKLLVYGAELIGQSNPSHPLETPPSCSLKLSANSTRRARWYAKLGYQPSPRPFPIPLMSVFPDGGLVGCTEVVIARVYPLVYLEKREGEKNVLRSGRLELKIAALHETERQKRIDTICSRVQKEFEEDVAKRGEVSLDH